MAFLNIKQALKEIFLDAMVEGNSLFGFCDGIVPTSASPLPSEFNKFIMLGDFWATEMRTGEMKRKFRNFGINITCCAVVRENRDGEAVAEYDSYMMAIRVRTLLKNNQKLISDSFPSGLAKSSSLSNTTSDFILYGETVCSAENTVFMASIEEELS